MIKRNIGQKILHFPLTKIIFGIIVITGVYGISKTLITSKIVGAEWFTGGKIIQPYWKK